MKSLIKTLLLGSACGLAITSIASAADLSSAVPLRGSVGSWTGLYGGVNGGYSWNEGDAVVFNSAIGIRPNPTGSVVGAQLGYNWQFTPDWVFGVETDIDWADINGNQSLSTVGIVGVGPVAFVTQQRIHTLGTLRARAGYVLEDVLLYATAGLAYGQTEIDTSITDQFAGLTCGPVGFCANLGSKQWSMGWAAGVGFDWSFLPRWSFRTEYLHYDLGSVHQSLSDPATPGVVITSDTNFRGDILRGAINYKFF
jgi:outer membrane immunogenic protein